MTENDRNDHDDRDDRTGASAAPGGPAAPGAPDQGTQGQGAPKQGTPAPGTPSQGAPGQGAPSQGAPGRAGSAPGTSGTPGRGPSGPGTPPQGSPTSGTPTSGSPTSGGATSGGATPPPYVPPSTPPRTGQKRGQVRQQEAGVTQPRPPTVAEQRARAQAIERRREAELAEEAEHARKKKLRKRLFIGGGVAVGVVGVVAIWYAASSPDDVEAQCTQDGVVVDDQYCDDGYARTHGGYSSGGFIYIGGSSYRYHYGGTSVPVGQKVAGGSYTVPKGANVTTKSGTTIQRGGFGVSGGSKSGGS